MTKRILVIEDDPDINKLLVMNLADANHGVDGCDNGVEGLELCLLSRQMSTVFLGRLRVCRLSSGCRCQRSYRRRFQRLLRLLPRMEACQVCAD